MFLEFMLGSKKKKKMCEKCIPRERKSSTKDSLKAIIQGKTIQE